MIMKLRKRLLASLLTLTLVVPLFSAAATPGTVEAADNTITLAAGESQVLFDENIEESARYAVLSGNLKVNAKLFGETYKVELSNYAVTTGKENALDALAGSKFTVEDTSGDLSNVDNSVYFPVESTEWTVEARVSLPNYDTIAASEKENRAAHVGPGAGSFYFS